jgi:hypothetical protein
MIAFALCAVACTKRNPDYCESSAECTNGYECVDHGCEPVPDAAAACPAHPCPVEMPVCQTDGSCALCSDDPQCSSGVCNADGSCEPDAAVIHVSVDGATTGDCGATGSPCSIEYARTKLTTERHTLALAGGDYALTEPFIVSSATPTMSVVGPSVARLASAPGTAFFAVSDGSALSVRGVSLTTSVSCEDATLSIDRVIFSDPAVGHDLPWVSAMRCNVTVDDSRLEDAPAQGIFSDSDNPTAGSLVVRRTLVSRSHLVGVQAQRQMVVEGCTVHGGDDIGVRCAGTCTLSKSTVYANHLGGARFGGVLTVTNNVVVYNGHDPDSDFGGLWLQPSGDNSVIAHNTVARNDSDVAASPRYAGGVYCNATPGAPPSVPNNLVCNNFAGNTEMSWSQIAGNCGFAASLVRNVCGTELPFVAPTDINDPDYHISSETSIAVDTATASEVVDDIDGDVRGTEPDFGADEYVP